MRGLELNEIVVKVDGRPLKHRRFADGIVLTTATTSGAERILADFRDVQRKVGLQLNLTKTMFTKNVWVPDAPFSPSGTTNSECSSYVCLGREDNMMNEIAPE